MHRPHPGQLLSVVFLIGLLTALVTLRAGFVDRNIGTYIDCQGCFHASVFYGDLVIFWLTAAALLLAGFIKPHLPGRLLHLAIGLMLVIYIADLVVFRLFSSRLFLADAALYFSEKAAIWDQFSSGVGGIWPAIAMLLTVIALLIFLAWMPPARSRTARVFLSAVLMVSLLANAAIESPPYVNDWATGNVFSANLATTGRVRYSPEFETGFIAQSTPGGQKVLAPFEAQSGRNVILILLESWSDWHSSLFGGEDDWTPNLDAAAQRGLRFTNFHSIGFSTDKGLVGILAGQKIWSPFLHWFETPPFHSMWGIEQTLPRVFTRSGYETAFLTSGPLSLYRKGDWLTDLGFSHVEGNEHPFYADEPRYAFGSASDDALYRRAQQWMKSVDEPYLLVLETVTTHQPYVDPESGERSLEKAMRYADRAFDTFLNGIEASGFPEDGLLVVVSDHRSMTPIPAREMERFGPDAFSRVPAFMMGALLTPGSADDRVLSQSDLVPTFEWWLPGSTRLGQNDAIMMDTDVASDKCAFHARGDRRGLLEVICPRGRGQIRLEGDQTRFVQVTNLGEEQQLSLLNAVAAERLTGLNRHRQTEKQLATESNN